MKIEITHIRFPMNDKHWHKLPTPEIVDNVENYKARMKAKHKTSEIDLKYTKRMKEKPIIFSTEMVKAIIDGRKTQTRRKLKKMQCMYSKGDFTWVRETWQHTKCLNINPEDENYGYVYKADDQPWSDMESWKWKPSIFMPKSATRLWLEIVNINPERLQDISLQDIEAEGLPSNWKDLYTSPLEWFKKLWESINGPGSWDKNPWVWVITFNKRNIQN